MKTREKILLGVTVGVLTLSFLIIPIMTEVSAMIGKYPSAVHIPLSDMILILFYSHIVTYFDQFYFVGWYVGYSLHMPNLSMDLAHYLNSTTDTSFAFVFGSSVFGYLEAPPWDAAYIIPAMYLPLLILIPGIYFSKPLPPWKRILYVYLIVTQTSVILRMILLFVL